MKKKIRIGIVQGRLSNKINNLIQAFPKQNWEKEFGLAKKIGFDGIEFIFDSIANPLFSSKGVNKIRNIKSQTNLEIFSISCDYSMFNPLFGKTKKTTTQIALKLLQACNKLSIPRLALSLEDNSSLLNKSDVKDAINCLRKITKKAEKYGLIVTLETSLSVINIKNLLKKVGSKNLKINFDLGNSCSLGEDTPKAILELKNLIHSIHIKDRNILFGTTVPLGKGDVNFVKCFKSLKMINFKGDIVIQGARGKNHLKTAKNYLKFVKKLIKGSNLSD